MSKQINAKELAEIVTKLLDDPSSIGEDMPPSAYASFMTRIAEVVAEHCGGAILHEASPMEDVWYIGVHGNECIPADGGVWAPYDKEGELFSEDQSPKTESNALQTESKQDAAADPKPDTRVDTKKVRIILAAKTRVEYSEILEVPKDMAASDLDRLVNQRYRDVDGGLYADDPDYWERSPSCDWELADPDDEINGTVTRDANGKFKVATS